VKKQGWSHFLPKLFDGLIKAFMGCAVVILLALMFVIVIHSAGRYLLSRSVLWIMEACAYGFMAIVFLGLGPTQKANRHVKVDLLERRLPPKISRFLQGIVAPVISLTYAIYFIWSSGIMAMRFFEKNSVGLDLTFMPLWVPAIIIPIGLVIFSLVLLGTILNYCVKFRQGKDQMPEEEIDPTVSL
jgi:TRAP-type C4-dicarboxylate transport system permease small subunit